MRKSNAIEKYLMGLVLEERNALSELRTQILKIIPGVEERLSRGVPFFYYKGKRVVGFRASKTHLSFFIMEGKVLKELHKEIAGLDYSSTVIRFSAENPIPEKIIAKLVKARIQEIDNSCPSVIE
ncbi:MAG TPA: DUF1801 domain-containing protein [Chryseolinea sp.]